MKTRIWNKLRALISHQTITSAKEEVCEENISLKNSIPTLLKDQNLVTTTPRVEGIHGICINCPKSLENQVKRPKTKESGFFEGKNKKH